MARKKKHPEHVNHERWLVSYADFMTLLFAFFVVMFAVSQVDGKKVGRFTESFSHAMGMEVFPGTGTGLLPGQAQPQTEGDGQKGGAVEFSEEVAKKVLSEDEIVIDVALGDGDAAATAYGCDLSYDYVKINGDYRS